MGKSSLGFIEAVHFTAATQSYLVHSSVGEEDEWHVKADTGEEVGDDEHEEDDVLEQAEVTHLLQRKVQIRWNLQRRKRRDSLHVSY